MKLKHLTCIIFSVLLTVSVFAQDSLQHGSFSLSGYADAYAASYSDSIGIADYQKYATISPRSNQFGLNIAMLSAKYSSKDVRGVFTLHYGDIPRSSWSSTYNFIQEANAGIRLCKNLWLDAGFFRTHVGTEALLPKENYTSTVALLTFFEPYYEAGARLNYTPSEKLSLYLYALNGYNLYEENNRKKSCGLLVTYVFNDKLNIGYSGYYGDDAPLLISPHLRLFHNAFLNFKGKKFKLTVGGDFATQQRSALGYLNDGNVYGIAHGEIMILSYQAAEKFRLYARGENFDDPNGFLSGVFADKTNTVTGLKIFGMTLGAEYKPSSNSYIRLEGRSLNADSKQEIFRQNHKNTNSRLEAMINIGFWFE